MLLTPGSIFCPQLLLVRAPRVHSMWSAQHSDYHGSCSGVVILIYFQAGERPRPATFCLWDPGTEGHGEETPVPEASLTANAIPGPLLEEASVRDAVSVSSNSSRPASSAPRSSMSKPSSLSSSSFSRRENNWRWENFCQTNLKSVASGAGD